MDTTHYQAIASRLARERGRLAEATTGEERAIRSVWVAQAEKELHAEELRLGMDSTNDHPMTDAELLGALEA